jgi:hypothetical protein
MPELSAFVRLTELVNETAPPPPLKVEIRIVGKDGLLIDKLPQEDAPPSDVTPGPQRRQAKR